MVRRATVGTIAIVVTVIGTGTIVSTVTGATGGEEESVNRQEITEFGLRPTNDYYNSASKKFLRREVKKSADT
ncbi:hypothetical protein HZH68_014091 [Vespula germanica]|uniref:Uncharacterized protein n=1 Tax=Vespula germanica TaxID=30212 RepID=A0A834JCD5_VESGE|nr:hypothetical protein HZH68_014091 [Vespula germanica]